jgi:putative transposase
MARLPRLVLPGMPHHVIQRGTDRCTIFRDNRDFRFLLSLLRDGSDESRCDIHTYVLMTNHIHLLLTPHGEDALSKMMQGVGSRYVQYFNNKYGRTGALWQGRYRAVTVDTERYFLVCSRYIELNPVRAGLVQAPRDYPWSSYEHHVLGRTDPLIRDHPVFESLGCTLRGRCSAYAEMFENQLDETTLSAVREATNKGWPVGDQAFRERVEAMSRRRARPLPKGGSRPRAPDGKWQRTDVAAQKRNRV